MKKVYTTPMLKEQSIAMASIICYSTVNNADIKNEIVGGTENARAPQSNVWIVEEDEE